MKPIANESLVIVFTKNENGEMATGQCKIFSDTGALRPESGPLSISFLDRDNRPGFIQGVVTWKEPGDLALFERYLAIEY